MFNSLINLVRSVFKVLYNMLDSYCFKKHAGFSKEDLRSLFIHMLERDDEDWAELNSLYTIRNTVVESGGYKLSVGGRYEDGRALNIIAQDIKKGDEGPKIVLIVDFWRTTFIPGKWQDMIKDLIEILL